MADQITTVPLRVLDVEPVEAYESSLAMSVADLARSAVERWARLESHRPFSAAWLATSFLADVHRQTWLGDWWHLYRSIAERHHAELIARRP